MFAWVLWSTAWAAPPEVSRLAGAWDWSALATEEEGRLAAIEEVVATMPLLFRPFARHLIRGSTPIPRRLCVRVEATTVALGDCHDAVTTAWDGAPWHHTAPNGQPETVTRRVVDGWLLERYQQAKGAGTASWQASDDGATVSARFTVESDQLPKVIRYAATYRRAK